jgi:competence protein ComFC
MQINIQKIFGNWTEGFALDFHTISSFPAGTNEYGRIIFDTTRPEIAEHLYQLKYRSDISHVNIIAQEVANFLSTKSNWELHKLIPIPPSDIARSFQPVYELAKEVGKLRNLEVDFSVLKKLKPTGELKSVEDIEQRKEILKGAFDVASGRLSNQNILLFDDLYRSGETLNAASDILKNKGKAANIYILTITKTRSKR